MGGGGRGGIISRAARRCAPTDSRSQPGWPPPLRPCRRRRDQVGHRVRAPRLGRLPGGSPGTAFTSCSALCSRCTGPPAAPTGHALDRTAHPAHPSGPSCPLQLNNPEAAVFCNNCNVLLHAAMVKGGQEDDCDACGGAGPAEGQRDGDLHGRVSFCRLTGSRPARGLHAEEAAMHAACRTLLKCQACRCRLMLSLKVRSINPPVSRPSRRRRQGGHLHAAGGADGEAAAAGRGGLHLRWVPAACPAPPHPACAPPAPPPPPQLHPTLPAHPTCPPQAAPPARATLA